MEHLPRLPFSLDPLIAEAKRRARQRRVIAGLVVMVLAGFAVGLTIAVRSPGGSPRGGSAGANFAHYGVSLRYPSAWARLDWCLGPGYGAIGLLTTAQPRPRCKPGATTASWPPPERLRANGVSIAFASIHRAVGSALKLEWNARIGGRRAYVLPPGRDYARNETCPTGIRREYRDVTIARSSSGMAALRAITVLCGPDLAASEVAVQQALASVRFTTPKPSH